MIDREMEYLRIAVEKTAGPREREAWRVAGGPDRRVPARQQVKAALSRPDATTPDRRRGDPARRGPG